MQQEWLADGSCFSQGETLREQAGKPVQRNASPTQWLPLKSVTLIPVPHFLRGVRGDQ
ncbi:hypothetical protein [Nostoc sp.]|uniref:hypothetical protein n=1 Tax=Nostoc sp. TaxID=1180 RepID=UPI002FF56C14